MNSEGKIHILILFMALLLTVGVYLIREGYIKVTVRLPKDIGVIKDIAKDIIDKIQVELETDASEDTPESDEDFLKFFRYDPYNSSDPDENPFLVNGDIVEKVRELTEGCRTQREKVRRIWQWICENIEYEKSDRVYRNSLETYYSRKGICFDQSVLAVTMLRVAGMDAKVVNIIRDVTGERVNHVAVLAWADHRRVMLDTTWGIISPRFHKRWEILNDDRVIDLYRYFRKKNP